LVEIALRPGIGRRYRAVVLAHAVEKRRAGACDERGLVLIGGSNLGLGRL
jgi:hypothetical protein